MTLGFVAGGGLFFSEAYLVNSDSKPCHNNQSHNNYLIVLTKVLQNRCQHCRAYSKLSSLVTLLTERG